jgi:hypothetical protein
MPGSEQAKAASSSGQTSTAPAKSDTPSGEPAQAQPASTGPARSETERTLLPAFYLKSAPAQTVTARESAQVPSPEVLEAFELNMPPLSPSGLALLAQLEHSYSSAWVLDAIREAEDLYPTGELRHPLGYLRKILARWKLDGHQARVVRGSTPDADDGPSRVESQIARFLADRPARRPSRGRDRGESHDAASFADTAIMSAAEVRSQMAELGSPR